MSIFISFSSKDREIAQDLCALLKANGLPYWISDEHEIPGQLFSEVIIDAIDNASVVLLLLSEEANASKHVASEISYAFEKEKVILPVTIGAVQLSKSMTYWLGGKQRMKYAPTTAFKLELVGALLKLLHPETPQNSHSTVITGSNRSSKPKWGMIAAIAAAAMVIVALVLLMLPRQHGGGLPAAVTTTIASAEQQATVTTPAAPQTTTTAPATAATTTKAPTTAAPTTTVQVAAGQNQIPGHFSEAVQNFSYQDRLTQTLFTIYLAPGEKHAISTAWPNVDSYSQNTAIATIDGKLITAAARGETYVVISTSPTMFNVYKVVVE
ncbi:MAG: toll/interleukin-1 receptor domain-containing protein [Clostridia bacterium]|nr:toll/interleukin-1 receptor domain-containing protein [Clostridia bacterium]